MRSYRQVGRGGQRRGMPQWWLNANSNHFHTESERLGRICNEHRKYKGDGHCGRENELVCEIPDDADKERGHDWKRQRGIDSRRVTC